MHVLVKIRNVGWNRLVDSYQGWAAEWIFKNTGKILAASPHVILGELSSYMIDIDRHGQLVSIAMFPEHVDHIGSIFEAAEKAYNE